MRNTRFVWLRRAWLLLVPLLLVSVAWEVHQVQKPIAVTLEPGDGKPSRELFDWLWRESQNHPHAALITVQRSTPFPKSSGLDLYNSENLEYNRGKGTLFYTTSAGVQGYGWVYGQVKDEDVHFLQNVHLGNEPFSLPLTVASQLIKRGCILKEQYSP